MKAASTIVHDTRRKKSDGTFPVKLRVTFERKQKYYPTFYSLTENEFERVMFGKRQTDKEKELKRSVQAYEDKATAIIDELPYFDWNKFEKHYYQNRAAKETIDSSFREYAKALRAEGRISTAITYECAQKSLNKFKAGLTFRDVTPAVLRQYENWMIESGCSITTVGIYLRSLRTLFGMAINDGLLSKELYPFGKKRYEIPTGQNVKKSLFLNDIAAIYNYAAMEGSAIQMARDYWLFMYFCNGMNMKDMCLLTYGNIKANILSFERAKTARTKRKVEPIRVPLNEDIQAIINNWGNIKEDENTFIFPILNKGITSEKQRQLVQQITHVVNNHMKMICAELRIENNVTTYAARHSFATILQRSGAPISFISEALGHGSVQTTQNYLAGFEDETKAETLKALTAFKKIIDRESQQQFDSLLNYRSKT